MPDVLSEEEAVRCFAKATLALLRTCRAIDHSLIAGEVRRVAKEAHESEVASIKNQQAAKPLLLNAQQAAKSLSISRGTLFNLTAPRGPIPSVKLGARVCYAVSDLERAVEALKAMPHREDDAKG